MIDFKSFLTESRSAPLYHGTLMNSAEKILKGNVLIGDIVRDDRQNAYNIGKKVIFVTRSLKHAKHYISAISISTSTAIFVLDQQKLSQRYKIKPIKNWQIDREDTYYDSPAQKRSQSIHKPMYMSHAIGGNEFEEVIIADRVSNISNYITKILVNHSVNPKEYPTLASDDRVEIVK